MLAAEPDDPFAAFGAAFAKASGEAPPASGGGDDDDELQVEEVEGGAA